MNLRKQEQLDYSVTIKKCWGIDQVIQQFSRNHECDLDERVRREVECLKKASSDFKFFDVFNDDVFVGYFGMEPDWLTTFFVMPECRKDKDLIWDYAVSHLPDVFYSGLFKINTRAISYYMKRGGTIMCDWTTEDKPAVILQFFKR